MSGASNKRKLDNEEEEDGPISLQDVIAEDDEMNNAADAVLGASNDEECTYPQGYMQRQALYACATCPTKGNQSAGFCLACSIECHAGCDLYELYTKRNFRCDCGNEKFVDFKCRLVPEKEINTRNKYGQNFKGLYCTCHRPYPDPEDDIEDEMIQCVACEDWFHGRHLGNTAVPNQVEYHEMICFDCSLKLSFIARYSSVFVSPTKLENMKPGDEEDEQIDIEGDNENKTPEKASIVQTTPDENSLHKTPEDTTTTIDNKSIVKTDETTAIADEERPAQKTSKDGETLVKTEDALSSKSAADSLSSVPSSETEPSNSDNKDCCSISNVTPVKIEGATFWRPKWRSSLCRCTKCMQLYQELDVKFLLDEEDTVSHYEAKGREERQDNPPRREMSVSTALEGMSRTTQVEMIHGYNEMRDGLSQYLKSFAETGRVVSPQDITEFFQGLARKRQRLDLSYTCR